MYVLQDAHRCSGHVISPCNEIAQELVNYRARSPVLPHKESNLSDSLLVVQMKEACAAKFCRPKNIITFHVLIVPTSCDDDAECFALT